MIDWDQPIELDDGREAIVISKGDSMVLVKSTGSPAKKNRSYGHFTSGYWYDQKGRFIGKENDSDFHVLSNSDQTRLYIPEDWS